MFLRAGEEKNALGGGKSILFLTVRRSPAPDLLDDLTARLGGGLFASELGLLDDLSAAELERCKAEPGCASIAAPLKSGAVIELSHRKVLELAQKAIARVEEASFDLIVLASTGLAFEAETACRMITAQRAVNAAVASIAMRNDRIGVVFPLARQLREIELPAFARLRPYMTHARHGDPEQLRRAAKELAHCDYILLHALCFDEGDRRLIADITGKPVILPRRALADAIELMLGASTPKAGLQKRVGDLTPRERQVMTIVCKGLSNKEIARRLGISHKTVEIHRSNILRKMNAPSSGVLISEMAAARLT